MATPMIDPQLFEELKTKVEQDTAVRKELDRIVDEISQHVSYTQGLLSRIHSTPRAKYSTLLPQVEEGIENGVTSIGTLALFASQHPYYKYNGKWTRVVQDAIANVLLSVWLGSKIGSETGKTGTFGRLLTLEEVGACFKVPVNLKDKDAFHITIEEYLLALVSIVDELSRLAMNAVTLGDYEMAVQISTFVKDLHAGFQVLNLKNDILRKRVDSIKYAVKKVEDVVYDLSLRNLIPTNKMEE